MESKKQNKWSNNYTWLLVMNAIYIVIFFMLMQIFS
jgi:hypothetical protein